MWAQKSLTEHRRLQNAKYHFACGTLGVSRGLHEVPSVPTSPSSTQ